MRKYILLLILLPSLLFAQVQIKAVIITRWTGNGTSTEDGFRPMVREFFGVSAFEDITGVSPGQGRNDVYVVSITADSGAVDAIDADTTFFVISQERENGSARNGKGKNNGLAIAEQNRLRQYLVSRGFSQATFNPAANRGTLATQIIRTVRIRKGVKVK